MAMLFSTRSGGLSKVERALGWVPHTTKSYLEWLNKQEKETAMPIPSQQLAQLRAGLQSHEKRILTLKALQTNVESEIAIHEKRILSLKALQTDVESEIAIHETIIKLGQDARLLAAIGEVHDKPELADQIQSNPNAFTQSRGIQLPPGVTMTAARPTSNLPIVSAHYQMGRIQSHMQWDKNEGFSAQEIR